MVMIVKANGESVLFDRKKAIYSCSRSGASEEDVEVVLNKVENQLRDGMTTKQIKGIILSELRKLDKHSARRYLLREAVAKMDTCTHQFEMYIANMFKYYGYKTVWEPKPKPMGYCTDHEIDVSIEKDGVLEFIECKHHQSFHRFTGLPVSMIVWAVLEDLEEGYKVRKKNSYPFVHARMITNTKVSMHAIQYANGKNIKLVGWNYPKGKGLNDLIEKSGAYPLNLLIGLNNGIVDKLFAKGIYDTMKFQEADDDLIVSCGVPLNKISNLKSVAKGLKESLKKNL